MPVMINEVEMQQEPAPAPAAAPSGAVPVSGGGPISPEGLRSAWRELQSRAARLVAD